MLLVVLVNSVGLSHGEQRKFDYLILICDRSCKT